MQNGTINGILFIIGMFLMGSLCILFPRGFQRQIEKRNRSRPTFSFVGDYYSGPYSILKIRMVGFFMYAMGALLFFWMFVR
jgi:hypothetical protein